MTGWYDPRSNKTIEDFIAEVRAERRHPCFKGHEPFQLLWDLGYLEPEIAMIRLVWGHGRNDEHYGVLGERELIGMDAAPCHGGKEGVHDPRDILTDDVPYWEAQQLNPHPTPRVQTNPVSAWYDPLINGTIAEYLAYCRKEHLPFAFKDLEVFHELWDLGFIIPGETIITLVHNSASDENYLVLEEHKLEGLELTAYSGREGIHAPEEVLGDDPLWENAYWQAECLDLHPEKRTTKE